MTPSCHPDWRGQWMSLHDLAALMGKSYWTVHRFVNEGTMGIRILRCGGRIWVRVEPSTYDSLIDPLPKV
jgi:predicted site-specific integrase-resolvase